MIDATHLELSEPEDLPPGCKVVFSVMKVDETSGERQQWLAASEAGLQDAYGDSEPDYSVDLIKEPSSRCEPR